MTREWGPPTAWEMGKKALIPQPVLQTQVHVTTIKWGRPSARPVLKGTNKGEGRLLYAMGKL